MRRSKAKAASQERKDAGAGSARIGVLKSSPAKATSPSKAHQKAPVARVGTLKLNEDEAVLSAAHLDSQIPVATAASDDSAAGDAKDQHILLLQNQMDSMQAQLKRLTQMNTPSPAPPGSSAGSSAGTPPQAQNSSGLGPGHPDAAQGGKSPQTGAAVIGSDDEDGEIEPDQVLWNIDNPDVDHTNELQTPASRLASDEAVGANEKPHVYSMLGTGTAMKTSGQGESADTVTATLRRPSASRQAKSNQANLQMRKRFSYLKTAADVRHESSGERLVRLQRKIPKQPLGFTLKTVAMESLKCSTNSKQNPTFIETVDPSGLAYAAGLRAGDHILKIDGEDCANAKHAHVVNLLKSNEGTVQVLVKYTTDFRRAELSWRLTMIEREMSEMEAEKTALEEQEKDLVDILSQDLCYASIAVDSNWSHRLPDLVRAIQNQWRSERSKWEAERKRWAAREEALAGAAGTAESRNRPTATLRKNSGTTLLAGVGSCGVETGESAAPVAPPRRGTATSLEVQQRTNVVGGRVVLRLDMGGDDDDYEYEGRQRTESVVDTVSDIAHDPSAPMTPDSALRTRHSSVPEEPVGPAATVAHALPPPPPPTRVSSLSSRSGRPTNGTATPAADASEEVDGAGEGDLDEAVDEATKAALQFMEDNRGGSQPGGDPTSEPSVLEGVCAQSANAASDERPRRPVSEVSLDSLPPMPTVPAPVGANSLPPMPDVPAPQLPTTPVAMAAATANSSDDVAWV